jgi:hypothetical protein
VACSVRTSESTTAFTRSSSRSWSSDRSCERATKRRSSFACSRNSSTRSRHSGAPTSSRPCGTATRMRWHPCDEASRIPRRIIDHGPVVHDDGSAIIVLTLATTFLGVGYHKRLVSMRVSPSIDTLNSPKPPLTDSTTRPASFASSAATRAAIRLLISQTGQYWILTCLMFLAILPLGHSRVMVASSMRADGVGVKPPNNV